MRLPFFADRSTAEQVNMYMFSFMPTELLSDLSSETTNDMCDLVEPRRSIWTMLSNDDTQGQKQAQQINIRHGLTRGTYMPVVVHSSGLLVQRRA